MSELLKKYESIDQSKLNEATIKIINRVKTITADFTADDEKNNKIAEQVLDSVMQKNPDAVKIVKREPKAKPAPKKTHKATHTAKATHKATSAPATKNSDNNIMTVAKQIQNAGESWKDAMERAKVVLKQRKEKVVEKKKTELEKLYALVKTKKELQGFANSDIKRDAVREAKPKGSRVVTKAGFTSNQHGVNFPNKLGRKYWETRDRHADRLAPNYPKDMPLLASGGVLPKDVLKEIYEAQEKSVKGGYFPEYESEMNYNLLVFGNNYAIEVERRNSREFPTHYYIYDTNFKYLGSAESINAKSKIDYSKLTKSDFTGTKFVGYKFDNGGSLPFMTDPNFGNFQNTGSFANGGKFKGFKFNVGDKVMVNTDLDFLNKFYHYQIPPTFEMGYDFTKPVTIVETNINSFNKPFYKVKTADGNLVIQSLPQELLSPAMSSNKDSDVKIKDWYLENYPTDDLGEELNDEVTFEDMWNEDYEKYNIYQVMGVGDSVIRERLFEHLAEIKGVSYSDVYRKLFLSDGFYADGGMTDLTMQNVSFADGGVLPKDVLKEIYEAQEKSVKGGYFPKFESGYKYTLLVFGNHYAIEIKNNFSKEFPVHNYIYDSNYKYLGGAESIKSKSKIDYNKLTKSDFSGTKFVGYKFADGGSLPFMTDPNFGNFQNTGSFADGGSMSDLTEQEFLKKYFGANVFTENPSQYFEIKKMSSSDDNKVDAFVKELKSDGFTVKKRAFSDFTSVMGVKKKASFELGGAFMMTDLAGHTGGSDGLGNPMPLSGVTGTNYTGLVGETGAMSSGELFEAGGAMMQNQQVIDDASQSYVNYYLGEGASQGIYKDGGSIPNNYEGKDYSDLWDKYWSEDQKYHFLTDHKNEIGFDEDMYGESSLKRATKRIKSSQGSDVGFQIIDAQKLMNNKSSELPRYVKFSLQKHIREGQYAKGGSIDNQYEGRTPADIWDNLTFEQREHFLSDHRRFFLNEKFDDEYEFFMEQSSKDWNKLNDTIKTHFEFHVETGQYASGGSLGKTLYVEYSSYFDSNNYDEEKIMSALKSIGAKNIRLENDRGWSNQPEVVVFNGDKNKAEEALNEAFDTDYIRVREKDWRTKKMADGGFMDNVYAKGGMLNKKVNEELKFYIGNIINDVPMSEWAVKTILKSALIDANFHNASKEVDSIFKRAKYTESVQFSKLQENAMTQRLENKGREIAKMCDYDAFEIIDSIAFYVSMNMGRPLGEKIENLKNIYAKGGSLGKTLYVEYSSYFDSNNYDEEKIMSALKSIGAKNIRLENDRGWSNQPEVVVFNGDKNKAEEALNEAFDTDYIRVREKDWRTKKMADGGFMDNVYASGGSLGKALYVEWSSWFVSNKYDEEKIMSVLESIGAKNIRLENDRGWSNQPEVVVFNGDKNKAQDALNEAFDTEWIRVSEKDWRTKKMADGGFMDNVYAKGGFVGTVEFNVGDTVWQKDEKRYATVMNNYGDPINGSGGDIRLDTSGNTNIFTYDKKYNNTGYNLVKVGEKGDTGKFTPEVLADMKASANRLIDSNGGRKDPSDVAYYKGIYKRLLDGEFDSMVGGAKATTSTKKGSSDYTYVPNKDVKELSVVLKGELKELMGSDILDGVYVKNSAKPLSALIKTTTSGKVTSPNYPDVNFNHKVVINGKTVNLALAKSYVTGLNGSKQYDFIDVDGNPMTGYGFSVKEALKDLEHWQNNPTSYSQTTPKPAKIDETKAHFKMDVSGGGKFEVFVDSNFVNQSQGNLPNTELKHYGFGDFYLQTPDGNIDFIRTDEEKEGFVGRTHKMKGSDELVLKLVNAMKEKGRFESTQTFADGGFMNNVYAKGGSTNRFVIVEGFDSFKNRPLYQVVDKSEQGEYVGEYHTNRKDAEEELKDLKNSFADGGGVEDVSKSLSVNKFYDQDGNLMGYTIKDKYNVNGKYTLSNTKEKAEEILQYLIDNPSRLAYYRKNEYADGGEMQGNNIDAELEDFDIDNLDPFETMQYNQFVKSSGKVGALQVLINSVEGDYSQLSPELAELAEMQMSQEDWDDATMNERFEKYGYANGGMFEDNDGFMRADNENNYRFPERPIHVDTLDEPIDLTDNVSYKPNEVVIESVDQDVNMNEDGRIRARMTQSNRGSAENFGKINPNAFEFIPMPTSNKHKND